MDETDRDGEPVPARDSSGRLQVPTVSGDLEIARGPDLPSVADDGPGGVGSPRGAQGAWARWLLAVLCSASLGWLAHRIVAESTPWNGTARSIQAAGSPTHTAPGAGARASGAGAAQSGGELGGNAAQPDGPVVDVQGDVRNPGVYRLSAGARVGDAVRAAGGFLHPEDARWLNEAAPLDDGQEVVVPGPGHLPGGTAGSADPSETTGAGGGTAPPRAGDSAGHTPAPGDESFSTAATVQGGAAPAEAVPAPAAGAKIDLNTADEKTLETLPGIGPTRANAILTWRQQHGRFHTVAELQNVPGIGTVLYGRIEPFVTVLP
ncbi:helix-hairpin-helix domain-containing protein [Alicyclobacillus sp.]|uniref:helix-hairpin-helix domain-containing protein n=1 Tax=Alicyclobacillus sp. TaxID=61169 RepID=UPI0025BABBB6|nr:helix-hairpin-helix domain-containing protein [Alicyclobacillus sp.]MCL6515979.1 helix-hairpin-helix domain-containing protein [Alicyclobacillus sp.]